MGCWQFSYIGAIRTLWREGRRRPGASRQLLFEKSLSGKRGVMLYVYPTGEDYPDFQENQNHLGVA
jgi:hypothetical protein